METTLTKIKDLAHVTVDSAFRHVPIDEERYELFAALGLWLADVQEDSILTTVPTFCNTSFTEWFTSSTEVLLTAVLAFKRESSTESPEELPAIVRDRSLRVVYTLTGFADSELRFRHFPEDESCESMVLRLWRIIHNRMRTEPGFLSADVNKRQGGSP